MNPRTPCLVLPLLVLASLGACTDESSKADAERIETELQDVQQKIDALQESLANASVETRSEIEKRLDAAHAEEEELNDSLSRLLKNLEESAKDADAALEVTSSDDD